MIIIVILATIACGIFYASMFEWLLHRYVMHRPVWRFKYPFVSHAQTHHRVFKADTSYHVQDESQKRLIPMAWWNGPILVLIGMTPFTLSGIPFAILGWWAVFIAILVTGCVVFSAYYGTYEYLHWCMHLPKRRKLEKSWLFQKLNGHHILHHRYMGMNFNVVLPIADALFGTLLLRAKTKFAQVRGESVPDLQPIPSPA